MFTMKLCKNIFGRDPGSRKNGGQRPHLRHDSLRFRSTQKGCAHGQGQGRVTWHGHVCDVTKIASSRTEMAGLRPNLHTTVSRWARIQDVLTVKVTGTWHRLIWLHKNRFFFHANGCMHPDQTQSFRNLPFPLSVPFSSTSHSPKWL